MTITYQCDACAHMCKLTMNHIPESEQDERLDNVPCIDCVDVLVSFEVIDKQEE